MLRRASKAEPFEHGNEPLDFVTGEEFLD